MNLSNQQFHILFEESTQYDRDAFISDWANSSMFLPEGAEFEEIDFSSVIAALGNIWDVAHMSIRDIRHFTGMTQAVFAERFCIPIRTIVNWEAPGSNHRECPPYVRLLLADACGCLHVRREG